MGEWLKKIDTRKNKKWKQEGHKAKRQGYLIEKHFYWYVEMICYKLGFFIFFSVYRET